MNLDINDLVNLNDVPLLDTEELSPGTKSATSTPFVLTPDRKQMKKRAKKRRSKLQIESKRDSLGLFQNLDNKEISMLDDWTPTIEPTPKKRASNKFIFASPIKQIEVQPENSNVDTQSTESLQTPKLKEMQILPSAVIETAPFVLDEIQPENIKTPEKPILSNDELLYTTPPKQIHQENFVEHKTEEKQSKTLKDLFNSIAEEDKKPSKLLGSAFKTPKSVSKMRSVIITPNLSLSTKKTPRIKLFSVTPKIPKDTTEDSNTNDESSGIDMPRSPTFADLGLSTESLSNLSTPSKIQPPTPKLSTWTASPAMCLTRNGVELSSPSSTFKRRMRLPYKASPRREGMTPIPMSLSGEFSRSKIALSLTPSLKKINEISSSEDKNDEQIQLSTSNSSIPEPPSSPTKSVLETPRKPRDTETPIENSSNAKNSSSTALDLIFSQELKERAEQLSNESAESRDISEDSTKIRESDSQAVENKSQQQQQQTILNKFFADKRKNMNMKKQLVKAFEEEEINLQKKDKESTKQQEETTKSTVVEKPKAAEGTISTGIPLPKTSVPKLLSGLRPTNTTTAPSTTKQSVPASSVKKSTPTTPSKSVKVSTTSTAKTTTSVLQKKTVVSKTSTSTSTSTISKPVPAATPSVASKKTSVTASATKTKPAPFVAATPLSQRSTARTPSTATKAPVPSTSKTQTTKSVFNSATSAKENIQNAAPPTVSKLETKKRKRGEDDEFSSSSAGMASFDQLLKQTTNPEPTASGSRRTTLLSSSLRRESSYFYRKEQEKKKQEEEDSDPLKLFEKQLEAAMKSGSAKANFGAMISSETDSPARKKAKIDC